METDYTLMGRISNEYLGPGFENIWCNTAPIWTSRRLEIYPMRNYRQEHYAYENMRWAIWHRMWRRGNSLIESGEMSIDPDSTAEVLKVSKMNGEHQTLPKPHPLHWDAGWGNEQNILPYTPPTEMEIGMRPSTHFSSSREYTFEISVWRDTFNPPVEIIPAIPTTWLSSQYGLVPSSTAVFQLP